MPNAELGLLDGLRSLVAPLIVLVIIFIFISPIIILVGETASAWLGPPR